jgi:hypothetical protein
MMEKDGSSLVKLESGWDVFDYASLRGTKKADTTWVLHLVKTGWYTASASFREGVPIKIPPDAQPRWTFICYDERFTVRVAHRFRSGKLQDELLVYVTPLTPRHTLLTPACRALRRAIAFPYPPCTASLPSSLARSPNLRDQLGPSHTFLTTLSPPLSCAIQTPAEFARASAAAAECNATRAAVSRRVAEARKAEGNAAYARGERLAAMERYSLALFSVSQAQAHLLGAWEPATQRLRAVVSANLAAASLMPGPVVNGPLPGMGMDPMRALEGGMMAETEDPTYAKGYVCGWSIVTQVCSPAVGGRYIRQAAALEKLGNKPEAVRAIRRALARPELENDRGLLARLAELLADGRGLPTE